MMNDETRNVEQGQLVVCLFNYTRGFGLDLKDNKQPLEESYFLLIDLHLRTPSSLK